MKSRWQSAIRSLLAPVVALGAGSAVALSVAGTALAQPVLLQGHHAVRASASSDRVHVCYANLDSNDPTTAAMGSVLVAQAKKRGWSATVLSNNLDGPTALKNVSIMRAQKCNYVIEFQADSTVQPVIARELKAAHIPEIIYDIPAPGAYFVGAPNTEAGILTGRNLGGWARSKFACKPDLVMVMGEYAAGEPSTLRANGIVEGLKEICPAIPASNIVVTDGGTTAQTAQAAARDILAAHPTAKNILVSGIADTLTIGAIDAAQQLGRAGSLYAWGDDGSGLLSGSFPPQLKGSTWFGLEGYPLYALRLISELHSGKKITDAFSPTAKNATLVEPCVIRASQAHKIPALAQRVRLLEKASPNTNESQLLCPAGGIQTPPSS